MKSKKIEEILVCIISLIVLTMVIVNLIGTKTYAATVNDVLKSNNTARENIEDEGDNTIDDNGNKNANNNINKNANNNAKNLNTNSGIPYTGVDNTVIFVIIAFGVSAVFAYKKIRDYKNI